ncbi:hypothetical protein ACFVVC_03725 [Pseudarthrobacter sp. NPDC058196]|uniref:hypothetical protein n=1 Tax=Pseudarthrobacter sp. NPDC058196 TaxID=3346376 RepID=UPI0036D9D70E
MQTEGRSKQRPDMAPFDLVWPPGLTRPATPPALLYLDLNHWINLTKAKLQRGSAERYQALLYECRLALAERRTRILLSAPLVEEIYAIRDPRQRNDLADLIEELTDFEYMASLVDVRKLELQATLDEMTGTQGLSFSPIPLIGKSLLHAFGKVGGLRLMGADGEAVDRNTLEPERLQQLRALEHQAERALIAGPSDEEVPGMRERGYAPEVHRESLAGNVRIEQHFADKQLSESWRRGRLRDVLLAREVNLELNDMLSAELAARHRTLGEVAGNLKDARRLVLSMPSSCVTVELKTHYHRDAKKRWSVNDLHDINAMSIAVPYCDIVFTDAAARNGLIRAKLHERLNTILPRTPEDLAGILRDLKV